MKNCLLAKNSSVENISKPKKNCIEKYKGIEGPDKEIIKEQDREKRSISGKLT